MRIGLLGYGTIAQEHALALSGLGCALSMVTGPRAESARSFAAEYGVERATTDVGEVLRSPDVDAVVIASPNAVHAEQVERALSAGKDVLCEVPMALTVADAERLASLSERSGRRVMVCQTQRFIAPMRTLQQWVSGRRIHQVVVRLVLDRTTDVGITGRRRSWTDDLVWHHGSHAVDTALWLVGEEIRTVVALGGGVSGNGTPMDVGVVMQSVSGALVTIALSYRAQSAGTDFLVMCDGATFTYAHGILSSSDGTSLRHDEADVFRDAVRTQDAAFVLGAREGSAAGPTPTDLVPLYRVLSEIARQASPRS